MRYLQPAEQMFDNPSAAHIFYRPLTNGPPRGPSLKFRMTPVL